MATAHHCSPVPVHAVTSSEKKPDAEDSGLDTNRKSIGLKSKQISDERIAIDNYAEIIRFYVQLLHNAAAA